MKYYYNRRYKIRKIRFYIIQFHLTTELCLKNEKIMILTEKHKCYKPKSVIRKSFLSFSNDRH